MPADTDMFDADARQLKDDLGFGGAAQETIAARVLRGCVAAHREAEWRRCEGLGLLVDRTARAPPPGTVNERPVRRVHQPDHGVIDRGGETDALDEVGRASIEPFEQRDPRRRGWVFAKKDPDVALHLARRVAADMDTIGRERLARYQRRDQGTMTAGVEAPPVIAALDLVPIEMAGAEPHAAMRTQIPHRERLACHVAADQDRLAQHDFRQNRSAP